MSGVRLGSTAPENPLTVRRLGVLQTHEQHLEGGYKYQEETTRIADFLLFLGSQGFETVFLADTNLRSFTRY